ncbi:unnamed protein product [Miscanthus lutarioriparius]|uniref:dolichol kinase n=1 Tax=Miscanthus lutarioriparius TaxID=422564 RepID=A0A811PL16_9POAL|nr:unnamed protein product [Miscanthus lutarioriparius]
MMYCVCYRPGASSGILLGATTLPSVMLSRLIQLSRLLPTDPNGPKEFAYLEMQYWATSISCLSLLALFLWHLRKSPSNGISKRLEYGSLLIVLYLMTFFLSFLLKTDGGLMVMTDMVYMLCHGVAAVILIKHILEKFPSCASFGEALLVSGGLVLYFGDMLAHTLSKMEFSMSSKAFIHTPGTRSDMTAIIQPAFLDLAFGAAFAVFLILEMIRFMNAFTDHRDSEILIVSHFSLLLGCALPKWMSSGLNDRPLAPFAGILSLGIGDTMASMIGYKVWRVKMEQDRKIGSLLIAVTLSGLLEAYTAQLDNAFIPLVFYSLLCL